MLNTGLNPLSVRYFRLFLKVSTIVVSLKSGTGVARILLLVQSYKMKIDVIPFIDLRGNLAV